MTIAPLRQAGEIEQFDNDEVATPIRDVLDRFVQPMPARNGGDCRSPSRHCVGVRLMPLDSREVRPGPLAAGHHGLKTNRPFASTLRALLVAIKREISDNRKRSGDANGSRAESQQDEKSKCVRGDPCQVMPRRRRRASCHDERRARIEAGQQTEALDG